AAALQPMSPLDLIERLADGDGHEQPPEVVAVGEPGEPAVHGPGTEAVEGAQRGIFLVLDGATLLRGPESGPCQLNHQVEVTIPERLGRGVISALQLADP